MTTHEPQFDSDETRAPARSRRFRDEAGVTLIELIISMVILAILMGIGMVGLEIAKDRSRHAKTVAHMEQIVQLVTLARETREQPLHMITGTFCTDCPCRNLDFSDGAAGFDNSACRNSYNRMINALSPYYNGSDEELRKLFTDGWGNPILLDENEGERNWCVDPDHVVSFGSTLKGGVFQKTGHTGLTDDEGHIVKNIPPSGYAQECQ